MSIKDTPIFPGFRCGAVYCQPITVGHLRRIFFPRNENERYMYLGSCHVSPKSQYHDALMPLIRAMDKQARPWWCPRWFLRFLEVFGNDCSIVRLRHMGLHKLHRRLTRGIRFIDWKTKWDWYDLRISIHAPEDLQKMADDIEHLFYLQGQAEERASGKEN